MHLPLELVAPVRLLQPGCLGVRPDEGKRPRAGGPRHLDGAGSGRAQGVARAIRIAVLPDAENEDALRGYLAMRVQRELLAFLAGELLLHGDRAQEAAEGAVQVIQVGVGDLARRHGAFADQDGEEIAGVGDGLREDDLRIQGHRIPCRRNGAL